MGLFSYDVYWHYSVIFYKLYHYICFNTPRNNMTDIK